MSYFPQVLLSYVKTFFFSKKCVTMIIIPSSRHQSYSRAVKQQLRFAPRSTSGNISIHLKGVLEFYLPPLELVSSRSDERISSCFLMARVEAEMMSLELINGNENCTKYATPHHWWCLYSWVWPLCATSENGY